MYYMSMHVFMQEGKHACMETSRQTCSSLHTCLYSRATKESALVSIFRSCEVLVGVDEPVYNKYGRNMDEVTKMVKRQFDAVNQIFDQRVFSGPCLLYTSPSPRDLSTSRMPSSA